MKKYTSLFTTYFASSIAYRADLASTVLLEAISVGSLLALWTAVFRTQHHVAGYNFGQAIAYYLVVPVVGFFTQVVLSDYLGYEIKNGTFSNYLLRPYRFWQVAFMRVTAYKLTYLLLVSPVIAGVLLYISTSGSVALRPASLAAALLIALQAFVFHFVLDLSVTFAAFWLDEVWAFGHMKTIAFSVLGGLSFPLEFVHGPLKTAIGALPFQYLYYVPVSYCLGKRPVGLLAHDMTMLVAWTLAAASGAALLWRLGLRKYGAYGR